MPNEDGAVRFDDLVKTYRTATGEVRALRGVSGSFPSAALVAVAGPSGSGKSSLLRLIAGMDRPSSGTVVVAGAMVGRASSRARRRMRRHMVGYVFQRPSDNFLPHLTVGEHLDRVALNGRADPVVEALGIAGRVDHRAAELSGGEQQRAAFAQALVSGARVVVADEPTAELDTHSADAVLEAIHELRSDGVTFVLATHDPAVMRAADVLLRLDHGEVVGARRPASDAIVGLDLADEIDPDAPAVLELEDVVKTFERGGGVVHAVDHASFSVREGEMVGLVGRSGSGKTTLLNIVAGWERADRGRLEGAGGTPPWRDLAVVPQKLGLIDELTVRENVAYPAKLQGTLHEHAARIDALLEELGLSHLAERRPLETSVGEQQRTAIVRALLLRPRLVVADEATGHQDRGWTEKVFAALRSHCDEGTACLVATHDETSKRFLNRTLAIHDGRIGDSE